MRTRIRIGCFIFAAVVFSSGAVAVVPLETFTMWQSSEEDVYSTGMIWRDGNNDGYIDGFFSNGNDIVKAANYIYISHYGTLPSEATWYSSNQEYSGHCSVGDIDDNGFPDFAVSNFISSPWYPTKSNVYLNFGGNLNNSPDWYNDDSLMTFCCALGDVDGDGDLDLALATGGPYTSTKITDRVYFNNGGVLESSPGWQSGQLTEAMHVTWGDVDNDGDLDLAFAYDDRGPAVYYNYNGVLETMPSWSSIRTDPSNTLIFADISGDGWLDLVVACNYQNGGTGRYDVYYNNGAGSLETSPSWQSADGGYGSAVSVYDCDHDGDDDLASGRWWDKPRLYENLGGTLTTTPVWRGNNATVVERLAWVDVDGDGCELFADKFYASGGRKLFYTEYHPLFAIDSVAVDGIILGEADYCYHLESGWVSLGQAPDDSLMIYYQYSFKNDLAVSNWDTYNMIYGNYNPPLVDMFVDSTMGWAPFTVQFTDSSVGGSNWLWRFGDGDSEVVRDPMHTYMDGGAFDVNLEVDLSDGRHSRMVKKMVVVLADTLYFPEVSCLPGDTVKVSIYLLNHHPLHNLILPMTYGGGLQLSYYTLDTDSCRTDYFEQVKLTDSSPAEKKLVFSFRARITGDNPPLEPGFGRILNIYFIRTGGGGYNVLDTTVFPGRLYQLYADYVEYQPYVVAGEVSESYLVRGDANNDQIINLLDIVYLIDYLYKGGPAPVFYCGDVNVDGVINLLDIAYLIAYLYQGGPPPPGN